MRPLAYTSPYCWIFLAIFLWAYLPEYRLVARSRAAPKDKADRGSMAVIMVVAWIGSLAAFIVAALPAFAIVHAVGVVRCGIVHLGPWPSVADALLAYVG